jgi:hypothetical protein
MMTRKTLRLAIVAALATWGLLFWLIAVPAKAQTAAPTQGPEVDLVLNCGTLKGNGTAVVKIYGRTFALLPINCERV